MFYEEHVQIIMCLLHMQYASTSEWSAVRMPIALLMQK